MPFPAKTSAAEIAEQALTLIRSRGIESLSMRQLAEEIGIKAPSLYKHFPDRRSLEIELGGRAAALLHARMLRSVEGKRSAASRVRAAGKEYVEFARNEPALFTLLLTAGAEGKNLWNFLLELIAGVTGNADDTASAVALWSFLHGFVTLERAQLFGESGPQGGLEKGLDALIRGLAAK